MAARCLVDIYRLSEHLQFLLMGAKVLLSVPQVLTLQVNFPLSADLKQPNITGDIIFNPNMDTLGKFQEKTNVFLYKQSLFIKSLKIFYFF